VKLTIFMHFWNEEFLLPFWLRHHVPLADHGVLVDYGSTDRSAEICRELAPTWELRRSKNESFDAVACDREIMALEREHQGWKLALNVTEFVFLSDLKGWLDALPANAPPAIGFPSYVMVDTVPGAPGLPGLPGRAPAPLWDQVGPFGYRDSYGAPTPRGLRVVHKAPDGLYTPGRHSTLLPCARSLDAFLLWFGWAPWPKVRARKLAIQDRIPASDRALGLGRQHIVTPEEIDRRFEAELARTTFLLEDPVFEAAWLSMHPRDPSRDRG
jgi:hypothetical protein